MNIRLKKVPNRLKSKPNIIFLAGFGLWLGLAAYPLIKNINALHQTKLELATWCKKNTEALKKKELHVLSLTSKTELIPPYFEFKNEKILIYKNPESPLSALFQNTSIQGLPLAHWAYSNHTGQLTIYLEGQHK